jgi:threonine dehydrogenase-like Zn-dependent dehydrogenase
MRAAIFETTGRVLVADVPDAELREPTDAVVRVVRACVCGSDLWAYRGVIPKAEGSRLGHEFIGIVEAVGTTVRTVRIGDFVIAPFQWSDNTCPACLDGIQTRCEHGGTFGAVGSDGGQGEAVRVPLADGTLVSVPGGPSAIDASLIPSLLALTDVAATGLHGAVLAGVTPGSTVAVVGDGAVGLSAVLGAATIIGAERIILMSRHEDRTELGRAFGATDVVAERGAEGIARVRELTEGLGVRHVVEAVGTPESWEMAIGMARAGGTVGAVGVPHTNPQLGIFTPFVQHLTLSFGIAPVRRYLPDLLARVLDGSYNPGAVFDLDLPLDRVGDAYSAMSDRRSIKTMLTP